MRGLGSFMGFRVSTLASCWNDSVFFVAALAQFYMSTPVMQALLVLGVPRGSQYSPKRCLSGPKPHISPEPPFFLKISPGFWFGELSFHHVAPPKTFAGSPDCFLQAQIASCKQALRDVRDRSPKHETRGSRRNHGIWNRPEPEIEIAKARQNTSTKKICTRCRGCSLISKQL